LFFKSSSTWAKPISFCGSKGLRIDRVFECEVVGEQAKDAVTFCLAAKFKLLGKEQVSRAEFRFDRIKEEKTVGKTKIP